MEKLIGIGSTRCIRLFLPYFNIVQLHHLVTESSGMLSHYLRHLVNAEITRFLYVPVARVCYYFFRDIDDGIIAFGGYLRERRNNGDLVACVG